MRGWLWRGGLLSRDSSGIAEEVRRVSLVRMPGPATAPAHALIQALRDAASTLGDRYGP